MSQTIELPEPVWSALQEAARASGVTPAAWIAAHLPSAAGDNGAKALAPEQDLGELEPPTYTSVPLEKVGSVPVACITGKEIPPLPYSAEIPE
jgi:hypothetical protein